MVTMRLPLFDSNILHSSVSVDGQVVGNVAKGEYLGMVQSPGEHIIKFDPQPYFQFGGAIYPPGTSSISTKQIVTAELGKAIYILAYNCTGYGGIAKGYSEIRDATKAREEIQDLESAW